MPTTGDRHCSRALTGKRRAEPHEQILQAAERDGAWPRRVERSARRACSAPLALDKRAYCLANSSSVDSFLVARIQRAQLSQTPGELLLQALRLHECVELRLEDEGATCDHCFVAPAVASPIIRDVNSTATYPVNAGSDHHIPSRGPGIIACPARAQPAAKTTALT